MEYKVVYEYNKNLLRQAADLHYEDLSYRSFITSFGRNFLYQLYKGILLCRLGFFVFANSDSRVKGFVLGCTDSTKLMSVIFRRFWIFAKSIIPVILKNPALITKLFETIFYSRKEGVKIKAELLVIAVEAKSRSKSIGSILVEKLNNEFKKQGILEYKVTAHKEMNKSNNFYLKNGMGLLKTFNLYNIPWNIYLKNIASDSNDES